MYDTILVTLDGKQIRSWTYENDDVRSLKIKLAHEYAEGWYDGYDAHVTEIRALLKTKMEK